MGPGARAGGKDCPLRGCGEEGHMGVGGGAGGFVLWRWPRCWRGMRPQASSRQGSSGLVPGVPAFEGDMQASVHLCPTPAWGSSSCGHSVGGCLWWVQALATAPRHSAKLSPFRVFMAQSGPCSCWDGPPRHPLHHHLTCVPAGSAAGMGTLKAWRGLGARARERGRALRSPHSSV